MAQYKYVARDKKGKIYKGKMYASSKTLIQKKLRDQGLRALELNEIKETIWNKDIYIGNPVKTSDFVIYLRQFATLIRAGVTILEATSILIDQTRSKPLKKALTEVEMDLREGSSLSAAYGKHPKIFSSFFVNMVHAGEQSGSLDQTLENLAEYTNKQYRTKQKIKSAMTYPVVVSMIAIGIVVFLMFFVIPSFVQVFEQFGTELPAITKMVLGLSHMLVNYWWLLLFITVGMIVTIVATFRKNTSKIYLDYIILKIPILGSLYHKSVMARFTRTLGSLLGNSVPILQALSLTEKIIENQVISRVLKKSRVALEQGKSMTDPMADHWAFPELVRQMIAIGERTGSLDYMLTRIAEFYEDEVDTQADSLKAIIEPVMLVVLSVIVGTIVMAIIVPMFEMFNSINY
ncbi:MAG: type II secretion system F family protein [Bacillaceae bacterium]|nr:type II secretion system F family protein [Bacillaceae bacterium]